MPFLFYSLHIILCLLIHTNTIYLILVHIEFTSLDFDVYAYDPVPVFGSVWLCVLCFLVDFDFVEVNYKEL